MLDIIATKSKLSFIFTVNNTQFHLYQQFQGEWSWGEAHPTEWGPKTGHVFEVTIDAVPVEVRSLIPPVIVAQIRLDKSP